MVKKKVKSTDSRTCHQIERDKDKRRVHDSNSKGSMPLKDQSIAISNVKLIPSQSTTIESSSPSFFN